MNIIIKCQEPMGLLTFTSNVLISFDQNNSSETLLVCNMPCQFRETLPDDDNNRGYVIKPADTDLKARFKTDAYRDAFILFTLMFYQDKKPSYDLLVENSRTIAEVDDELDDGLNLLNTIRSLFEINPLSIDSLLCVEVHRKISFSTPCKITVVLTSLGVKKKKVRGNRYYSGLRLFVEKE
jgi:hypothetical protein